MIQFIVAHQPALLLAAAGVAIVALVLTVVHRDESVPPRRR